MKFKTTKKAILNDGRPILRLDDGKSQHLLSCVEPMAYTSGMYGWNADIYLINGVYLVRGYRPFGKIIDFEKVKQYDKMAYDIIHDFGHDWKATQAKVYGILIKLIEEETKNVD